MTTATLARRQLRTTLLTALQALVGITVESPPTTATAPRQLPYVGLRCGAERKVAEGKRLAKFTTTSTLEILARVAAPTQEAAQDALEQLAGQIEAAVFGDVAFIALVQQLNVTTNTEISAEGSTFLGGLEMSIDCELYEVFDPTQINPYPARRGSPTCTH